MPSLTFDFVTRTDLCHGPFNCQELKQEAFAQEDSSEIFIESLFCTGINSCLNQEDRQDGG